MPIAAFSMMGYTQQTVVFQGSKNPSHLIKRARLPRKTILLKNSLISYKQS